MPPCQPAKFAAVQIGCFDRYALTYPENYGCRIHSFERFRMVTPGSVPGLFRPFCCQNSYRHVGSHNFPYAEHFHSCSGPGK